MKRNKLFIYLFNYLFIYQSEQPRLFIYFISAQIPVASHAAENASNWPESTNFT